MNGIALALVLCAAFCHAIWNMLAKRVGSSATFVWLFAALSTFIYLPVMLMYVIWQHPVMNGPQFAFIFGSAVLHVGYFLLLQRGYRVGDLSLVYPLARGIGPLLSTLAAIALLGERPTLAALLGVALIVGGIFVLVGGPQQLLQLQSRTPIIYAALTGIFVAAYTVWDKYTVSTLLAAPIVMDWSSNVLRTAILTPLAVRNWQRVRHEWKTYRLEVYGVALLSPLAYILVLIAMTMSSVSHIAPTREVSILIGTLIGTHLLAEGYGRRRFLAACIILGGIVLLALN